MTHPTILIVDDDPLTRKLVRITLQGERYNVLAADDGRSALEVVANHHPDLVLQDLILPDVDGFDLVRQLRALPGCEKLPILALSGFTSRMGDAQRLHAGFTDYLLKPVEPSELLRIVRGCVAPAAALQQEPGRDAPAMGSPAQVYADRTARQLGRQATISADLAQRLAWIEAKLAVLNGLAETMKRSSATGPLIDDILYRALEAVGAPRGAAYLLDPGGHFSLRTEFGYHQADTRRLADFFGRADLLRRSVEEGAPVEVPSDLFPAAQAVDLLQQAGARSMLITPLMSGEERLGALTLAWTSVEREGDWRSILTAVAVQVSQAIGLARALSQLRESERRLAFLARASAVLSESLDYDATLANVVKLAVPDLADWCAVEVMGENGWIRRLAVGHADPAKVEQARVLETKFLARGDDAYGVAEVMRTGKSQFYPEVSPARLAAEAHDPEHLKLLCRIGPKSAMVVPIAVRGEVLAAVTFATAESGRRYGEADLALAEELARRYALALDNARLYREAKSAVSMRDEFLSIAAHELRTPVTSLRGFAQVTLRHMEKTGVLDSTRLRRTLEVMDQQSDKLASLISRLLDVSRLEAGRLVLQREMVDLWSLVEGIVASARAGTSQHNLVIAGTSPLPALVDPLRVEQVVTNLLDNAVKFSPNGGQIDVGVRLQSPSIACLSVRDRGIGIPSDHHERVFERFYQSRMGHLGGMGLGLYVTRRIVDLHGGRIWVESPEDGGTRFVVELPTGLGNR